MSVRTLKTTLAALLIGSAALLVVGVAIERSQPAHSAAREAGEAAARHGGEAAVAEGAGEGASAEGALTEGTPAAPTAVAETRNERVFGIDPEAGWLVVAAVAASVLMAVAAWRRPELAPLLLVVALASLAFAAFDVREAFHQAGESRTGLMVIASVVAALHLGAAALAALMAMRARDAAPRARQPA